MSQSQQTQIAGPIFMVIGLAMSTTGLCLCFISRKVKEAGRAPFPVPSPRSLNYRCESGSGRRRGTGQDGGSSGAGFGIFKNSRLASFSKSPLDPGEVVDHSGGGPMDDSEEAGEVGAAVGGRRSSVPILESLHLGVEEMQMEVDPGSRGRRGSRDFRTGRRSSILLDDVKIQAEELARYGRDTLIRLN